MSRAKLQLPEDNRSPIVDVRKLKGLSQGELALVLDCSKTHMSELESGNAEVTDEMVEILDGLGLDGEAIAQQHLEFIKKKREWLTQWFLSAGEEPQK